MQDENSMDQNYEDSTVEYVENYSEPEVTIVGNGSNTRDEMSDLQDTPTNDFYSPHDSIPQGSIPKSAGVVSDLATLAYDVSSGDAARVLMGLEQFSKSQLVRFLDITVIGPILLLYAYKGRLSAVERSVLGLIGLGTVIYNGRNFLKKREMLTGTTMAQIKAMYEERL